MKSGLPPLNFLSRNFASIFEKKSGNMQQQSSCSKSDTLLHLQGDTPKLRIESTNKLEASAGHLLPVIVKAIQELSVKVTALEAG